MSILDALLARDVVPDPLLRVGIRRLLRQRLRDEGRFDDDLRAKREAALAGEIASAAIATDTDAANEQHYEVPPAFFERVLGPRLKYSGSLWHDDATPEGGSDLAAAETAMIDRYFERAELVDGQRVLELGCGWGSFCLEIARRHSRSQVTGVSNSAPQRRFIESRIAAEGLENLRIVTADINAFQPHGRVDRIVSIEMFEHVRNHRSLFSRVAEWLTPEGKLFVHIFCHRELAYLFESEDAGDWMSRHFFTGGIMPSADLLPAAAADHLDTESRWLVNGRHYARTSAAWLANMDAARDAVEPLFAETYGSSGSRNRAIRRWWSYWRIFFMACEELFAYEGGEEWMVAHYRFARRRS